MHVQRIGMRQLVIFRSSAATPTKFSSNDAYMKRLFHENDRQVAQRILDEVIGPHISHVWSAQTITTSPSPIPPVIMKTYTWEDANRDNLQRNAYIKVVKWHFVGLTAPSTGRPLTNERLSNALQQKTEFTVDELKGFGLPKLEDRDYIRSNGAYFQTTTTDDKHCRLIAPQDREKIFMLIEIYMLQRLLGQREEDVTNSLPPDMQHFGRLVAQTLQRIRDAGHDRRFEQLMGRLRQEEEAMQADRHELARVVDKANELLSSPMVAAGGTAAATSPVATTTARQPQAPPRPERMAASSSVAAAMSIDGPDDTVATAFPVQPPELDFTSRAAVTGRLARLRGMLSLDAPPGPVQEQQGDDAPE